MAWRGERGTPAHSLRLVAIALFAILAVIIVAPTFSKYLAAQQELSEARSDLADSQARVESLQHELDLWNDKDYVKTQARERLGYVMPGQTLYVVSEPSEGTAQEKLEQKVAEVNRDRRAATPWFSTLVDSISVAGQAGELDNPNSVPIVTPDGGTTTSDPTVAPTTAPSSSPVQ